MLKKTRRLVVLGFMMYFVGLGMVHAQSPDAETILKKMSYPMPVFDCRKLRLAV